MAMDTRPESYSRSSGTPSTPAPIQIPRNDPVFNERSTAGRRNQYFVPGEGISRNVISADICKYLDNDATIKPGTYQGRDGYFLFAYRNLTSAMLEDIRSDSQRFEEETRKQQAQQSRSRPPPREKRDRAHYEDRPYEESATFRRRQEEGYSQSSDTPPPGPEYASRGGPAPPMEFQRSPPYSDGGFSSHSSRGQYPYPSPANYPPAYGTGPEHAPPGQGYAYGANFTPGPPPQGAAYGHTSMPPQDMYRSAQTAPITAREPMPPSAYVDPRDPRSPPQDPRQTYTEPRPDQRDPRYGGGGRGYPDQRTYQERGGYRR